MFSALSKKLLQRLNFQSKAVDRFDANRRISVPPLQKMRTHYESQGKALNEARLRMATLPTGKHNLKCSSFRDNRLDSPQFDILGFAKACGSCSDSGAVLETLNNTDDAKRVRTTNGG